jgi:gas vesicle structural protein
MTMPNSLPSMARSRSMRPRGFERPASLSEVLDRVLNKGAVVVGEVVISVAGVDLLYLGLNVVLTSVETARKLKSETEIQHAEC